MIKRNAADTVRADAIGKAKSGLGITSCPYKRKSPFQTLWLLTFKREIQVDWVDQQQVLESRG